MMFYLYGFFFWFFLLIVAAINGAYRQSLLRPALGEHRAQMLSTLILSAVFTFVILVFVGLVPGDQTTGEALILGACWTVATIFFELFFGHYIARRSWAELLQNYDVIHGYLWPLVLVVLLLGPVAGAVTE